MVTTVEVELAFSTRAAGMKVPAHNRRAAMGDGPDGAPLCLTHGVRFFTHMVRQEAVQRVDDGGSHGLVRGLSLTGQFLAERFHQGAAVLLAAVGDVEIYHGGVDIGVT